MKSLSHVRLCDPTDCSLPGSSIHGIFQARVLQWGAIAFSGHAPLEHYISSALATNSPEYLVLPEPLQSKQLHQLHTWPFLGQTQVHQSSLRSKLQWMIHVLRWK